MTEKENLVSVVIVSYNVKDFLLACIDSLYLFEKGSIEIIVVDNNSLDGSMDEVAKRFPLVKLIRNDFNAGFSSANNMGMQIATGRFICLLNPDTQLRSNALSLMREEANHNHKAIYATTLLNSDNSLQVSCWKFPSLASVILETFFLHLLFRVHDYPREKFKARFEPDWASGAAILFHHSVAEATGGFDTNLFWMDDVDFCFRAKKLGNQTIYLKSAGIIHHGGKSSAGNQRTAISNQILSKIKYFMKHHGPVTAFIAGIFLFLHIITRLFVFSLLSFTRTGRIKLDAYFYSLKKFLYREYGNKNTV